MQRLCSWRQICKKLSLKPLALTTTVSSLFKWTTGLHLPLEHTAVTVYCAQRNVFLLRNIFKINSDYFSKQH